MSVSFAPAPGISLKFCRVESALCVKILTLRKHEKRLMCIIDSIVSRDKTKRRLNIAVEGCDLAVEFLVCTNVNRRPCWCTKEKENVARV